jgi:hypothetical protein
VELEGRPAPISSPDSLQGIKRQRPIPVGGTETAGASFAPLTAQGVEILGEPTTRGIFATDASGTAYGMPRGVIIARSAARCVAAEPPSAACR